MKRFLERLTFFVIGAIVALRGNLLNTADTANREVTYFDEIDCRKIVIDDGSGEGKIILLCIKNRREHLESFSDIHNIFTATCPYRLWE